uniref:Protein still life, isoforms C/SIF type 2-like isoform X1 n=2 Tax=Crassostrea virginica TaxID=6565 RepID=A0A8B8A8N2_CRAVI|nr:protein still life, isoforms C/SIF type 2-like isoform X1 [Crassostrea virginica]
MAASSNLRNFRKLLTEILETEKTYVKNLEILSVRYLDPLSTVTFVTSLEIRQLSENLQEILRVQRLFLQSLKDEISKHSHVFTCDDPDGLGTMATAVSKVFLSYAEEFKIYSSFCALYSKVQDILNSEENDPLRNFLESQNETKEHCNSLESFIIQPVQRVLKYPLLLKQMASLSEEGSTEHRFICEALAVMERVTKHINAMQRLSAEFSDSFRCLSSQDLGVRDLWAERPDLDHPADNIPVIKSGYGVKEGGKMKSWKRRFFVLNEYGLFYYVSEESSEPLRFIPRNDMKHAKASTVNRHNGGLYGMFELYTEDRTYFVECESPADVQPWIRAIRRIIPRNRKKMTVRNTRDSIFYTSAGSLKTYKSGYCVKQGGKWKSWLSRYFVVNEDGIMYFSSEQSIEALGVIMKDQIQGVQEISASQMDRENVFEIITCCRTYYVQCESHGDLCEWVTAIRRLLPTPKIKLNVGDIRTHGVVDWYNIRDIVGSRTHPCNTTTSVFVFQTAVAIISRKNEQVPRDKVPVCSNGSSASCVPDLFRSLIPGDDITLEIGSDVSKDRYLWSITQSHVDGLPERTYLFASRSEELRSKFVSAIQEVLFSNSETKL